MNQHLIHNFQILVAYYSLIKDNFRRMSYEKAIRTLQKLNFEISNISEIKGLPGIGKGIQDKIKEFLQTGYISKVEEAKLLLEPEKTDKDIAIEDFLKIWGVGPVKAEQLWNKGFRIIADLFDNPGMLTGQQRIGLAYYADLQQKIPRSTITAIQVIIRLILDKEIGKGLYSLTIAGSYRRGKNYSNDIDVLISSPFTTLKELVRILQRHNIITDILSLQDEKFMGIGHCPRENEPHFRIDIEFLPEEEIPFGLLYFTGSKDFNKEMRWHAKKLGYTLNQHGLKVIENDTWIPARSEEEIFRILGLEYVLPRNR